MYRTVSRTYRSLQWLYYNSVFNEATWFSNEWWFYKRFFFCSIPTHHVYTLYIYKVYPLLCHLFFDKMNNYRDRIPLQNNKKCWKQKSGFGFLKLDNSHDICKMTHTKIYSKLWKIGRKKIRDCINRVRNQTFQKSHFNFIETNLI